MVGLANISDVNSIKAISILNAMKIMGLMKDEIIISYNL